MILNDYLGLFGYSGLSLGLGFAVIGLFTGSFSLLKKDQTFFRSTKLPLLFNSFAYRWRFSL